MNISIFPLSPTHTPIQNKILKCSLLILGIWPIQQLSQLISQFSCCSDVFLLSFCFPGSTASINSQLQAEYWQQFYSASFYGAGESQLINHCCLFGIKAFQGLGVFSAKTGRDSWENQVSWSTPGSGFECWLWSHIEQSYLVPVFHKS